MKTFAVEYSYDITRTHEMDALRPQHRAFLRGLLEAGILLASGPWVDGAAPGALLLVRAENRDGVLRLLDDDPFHRAHVISHRSARAWDPTIGPFAS